METAPDRPCPTWLQVGERDPVLDLGHSGGHAEVLLDLQPGKLAAAGAEDQRKIPALAKRLELIVERLVQADAKWRASFKAGGPAQARCRPALHMDATPFELHRDVHDVCQQVKTLAVCALDDRGKVAMVGHDRKAARGHRRVRLARFHVRRRMNGESGRPWAGGERHWNLQARDLLGLECKVDRTVAAGHTFHKHLDVAAERLLGVARQVQVDLGVAASGSQVVGIRAGEIDCGLDLGAGDQVEDLVGKDEPRLDHLGRLVVKRLRSFVDDELSSEGSCFAVLDGQRERKRFVPLECLERLNGESDRQVVARAIRDAYRHLVRHAHEEVVRCEPRPNRDLFAVQGTLDAADAPSVAIYLGCQAVSALLETIYVKLHSIYDVLVRSLVEVSLEAAIPIRVTVKPLSGQGSAEQSWQIVLHVDAGFRNPEQADLFVQGNGVQVARPGMEIEAGYALLRSYFQCSQQQALAKSPTFDAGNDAEDAYVSRICVSPVRIKATIADWLAASIHSDEISQRGSLVEPVANPILVVRDAAAKASWPQRVKVV